MLVQSKEESKKEFLSNNNHKFTTNPHLENKNLQSEFMEINEKLSSKENKIDNDKIGINNYYLLKKNLPMQSIPK